MHEISIILRRRIFQATLDHNSRIAGKIYHLLPITSRIDTWGHELYFPLFLDAELERPVETVTMGDIAYSNRWKAICIFYGKTPLSPGREIVPNGPVEVIGKVDCDPLVLRGLLSGFMREKRRRMFNRFSMLRRFSESIVLDRT